MRSSQKRDNATSWVIPSSLQMYVWSTVRFRTFENSLLYYRNKWDHNLLIPTKGVAPFINSIRSTSIGLRLQLRFRQILNLQLFLDARNTKGTWQQFTMDP